MSFFNYLSARQYSLDSTNYGAPSNATINTDSLADIVLNPSPSATVIVPSLALNAVEQGATTNPTITTDEYGDIYLNPDTASSVQITSNLTITGTALTLGNGGGNNTIQTAGNLDLNSGAGDTVQLSGAVVNLNGTSATYLNSGSLAMKFPGTTTTGNDSFYFGTSTSGSTTGLAQMNMYNNQNTTVGTFLIDSENNLNIYNETATTFPSLQLASSGDISLNASSVQISGTTLTIGNATGSNTIETAGNLDLNSGASDTVALNGAVVSLNGTSGTYLNSGSLYMRFPGTTTTGNNSFFFGTYTSGSETDFSQMNMYNSSNSAVGTITIDSLNNFNIINEVASASSGCYITLTSGGEVNVTGVFNAFSTIQSGTETLSNSGTVTFPYTFSSAPIVICTPCLSGGTYWSGIISVTASTTTTFTVNLVNYTGDSPNTATSFNWIAMVAS